MQAYDTEQAHTSLSCPKYRGETLGKHKVAEARTLF